MFPCFYWPPPSQANEQMVLHQFSTHLSANNPFQFAYQQVNNVEISFRFWTNLLLTDSWKVSLLTLLDAFTASDTTDHSIFLSTLLYSFGITDSSLSLLVSFLPFQYLADYRLFSSITCGLTLFFLLCNHSFLCHKSLCIKSETISKQITTPGQWKTRQCKDTLHLNIHLL